MFIKETLRRINIEDRPLNILTCPTHERYESNLAKTGHNFFAIQGVNIKDWKDKYAKRPNNYKIIKQEEIPYIGIDLVLIQQKFGQYQLLKPIAESLSVPSIVLEHTLPMNTWKKDDIKHFKKMSGELNVFISNYSKEEWGWKDEENCLVVPHGINTEKFKPIVPIEKRNNYILSIVNDWVNRDYFCGYSLWKESMNGLPVQFFGETKGFSIAAKDEDDLVNKYNENAIFLNTSLVSPIPTVLMEAMSCGCAVITTNNCMIPEVVKDGYNGILCNTAEEIKNSAITLLKRRDFCKILGENARKTIEKKYNLDRFVKAWNNIFMSAIHMRVGIWN